MAIYVDIHAIQTLPYANINRDAEGSPKSLIFGGVERTRVSSQSWKRAIRHGVEERVGEKAVRSRLLPLKVAQVLCSAHDWPDELATFAGAQVAESTEKALKIEPGGATSVLLYLPVTAAVALAALCTEFREQLEAARTKKSPGAVLPKDRVTELVQGRTATINLFGRMLAEIPGSNVDGAVQIAHAFTTHQSDSQRDFFTAVDDWLDPSLEVGAGHMGSAEYSAGVFYRYATVNIDDLLANLDQDRDQAGELVALFLEQFIMSLPQAKKTSTAPYTVPDLSYAVVRKDRPISGAAAFEQPVRRAAEGGIAARSVEAFARYMKIIDTLVGTDLKSYSSHVGVSEKPISELGERHESFRALALAATAAAFDAHRNGS